ncbi:hypothetical protein IE4872_CH01619 [Rhizobium gallicum]|uniref:Uncharacterized protein n=1 Tax=Rhizobium gallicum TaxID=56730 RepID=A0A1L5NHB3_9HYPH|nr:hypothetical protein [Rhizobium gallicum]APO67261.1 hypothetical protein IE4872_CH01619 [Rhizobium gallicum]
MQITYSSVRNPRWVSEAKRQIHCFVRFDHIPDEEVEFVADPTDCEPHGREIFEKCVAGAFGEIAMVGEEERTSWPTVHHGEVPGWASAQEFLKEANLENESKTDRGMVIVWGSALEEFVKRLLQVNGVTPHFNYSRSIARAKSEKLISETLADNLDLANEVRKEFAHKALTTFASGGLHCQQAEELYQRVCGDGIALPLKKLYGGAASTMLMELLRAINASDSQRKPSPA